MWICFDHIRGRDRGSGVSCCSLLFLSLLCWCCSRDAGFFVVAIATAASTAVDTGSQQDSQQMLQSPPEVTLPPPAPSTTECKNLTAATTSKVDSRLSVIESADPNLPIVPPAFLNGALTCQPYQGIYVNHIYFQLANAFFLLSHLAPSGLHGVLYLRCTLLVGCAFLALWAWTIVCWLDAALWNALFVVINFVHVCTLLYRLRPVKFSKEIEEVYVAVFQPLRVSRHQFKKVLSCMKIIRQLKYQEVYAQEKVTKVDSLSLVLSGKLVVSQNGKALHIVFPHQFLDSPEWFGVSTDEFFQVSITAMEESRVLLWHRDKLKLSIISDQFLQAVFDHILGRDVVKKLMQVSETMAAASSQQLLQQQQQQQQQQNGQVIGLSHDTELDAKMFVVKKTNDSQGITALISRQLQGKNNDKFESSNLIVACTGRMCESYQSILTKFLSSYVALPFGALFFKIFLLKIYVYIS
ncbi:blood vessel epicardial substance isoform X1 [Nasonia vitripennis]|uniref:POPDC1-3 domain-containing protein n=1 Tax=Nasonia vitripennis TaxID=7425 RepID=A0A7M7M2U4_NASVI|nr:blood vessel epicardial substance isoform X1 [Nasonia vitripennis]XP_008202837.1 blood vessel epicardial substance isoform X1 [Nasonia vitripennis]XP_008202838.1 blood vessel epicardial substance isoform X1 [Nasonia vitripennis]XP_008202839.1 blood vessel epicardial substance isoform X1 [Nasonia vitripennis]XP_016845656.1 blood vessel epicardial substance isoform X1 [Nasonia vitripennis]XP_016845657.1 blood vessel epicardial substance isoform X1 [Nasonia vitripennis]XP_016845658.1 blood ve